MPSFSQLAMLACLVAAGANSTGMVENTTHQILSEIHHSLHPGFMPVSAHMLRIRTPGIAQARILQGHGTLYMAHSKMQSMGRLGLRPGAVSGILSFELKPLSKA